MTSKLPEENNPTNSVITKSTNNNHFIPSELKECEQIPSTFQHKYKSQAFSFPHQSSSSSQTESRNENPSRGHRRTT
jgi:hypothetical protein